MGWQERSQGWFDFPRWGWRGSINLRSTQVYAFGPVVEGGMEAQPLSTRKRIAFAVMIALAIPLVGFLLLEGGSSLLLLGRDVVRGFDHLEEPITRYDTLLGWAGRPGLRRPNEFGPGKSLQINALGFRGAVEPTAAKSPDRVRVICSGDSFAFGDGVGDDAAWCGRLGHANPVLEPINMGQPGYGVDQAYLWFLRDGLKLRPDVHLFTFIWDDFTRMQTASSYGFGKPVLRLDGSYLRVDNVPVPRTPYEFPRLARFGREVWAALHGLRAYDLVQSFREGGAAPGKVSGSRDSLTWQIASTAIRELADTHRARGAVLILVHMAERLHAPGLDGKAPNAEEWRRRLRADTDRLGFHYLDLGDELERLPPDSQIPLFLPDNPHYSERGHAWVATRVYRYLTGLPELRGRLDPDSANQPAERDLNSGERATNESARP
jgi:hypothetical protein